MKFWIAFLIGVLAFADSAAASVPNQIDTQWSVSLDAQGRIVRLANLTKLDAPLRDPLEKAIRSWAFDPGKIDGQPAATDTTLTLSLTFEPQGSDKYTIRINDARVGGRLAQIKFPSTRSFSGEILGGGASAILKLNYNEGGKVMDVELQDVTKSKPHWKKEVLLAAKAWTFLPERVGGRAVAASAIVPLCVWDNSTKQEAKNQICAWTPPGAHSNIASGQAFALDPAAKLLTDVIGHTL